MYDSTFTPKGPTYLVGTATVQCSSAVGEQCTSYRIRCLASGYLAWAASQTTTAPVLTATAPANGVPSTNTIGMTIGGVETLSLPQNAWFESSVAAGFEVTPGEGV